MEALNHALKIHFPETSPHVITGGFFAALTFPRVAQENETAFVALAREKGVSIAPAWDAVAPDFRADFTKKGLFIRLTFPALDPEALELGILRLKETADSFGSAGSRTHCL
jgi:DNA-binding transcriptional MocR family regulator